MGNYFGYVPLGSTIKGAVVTKDASNIPKDATGLPSFRVYGPAGIMNNGTGSLTLADPSASGGAITSATNATPIVIGSTGHGLNTGTRVTIAGVLGNTAANGTWVVTVLDGNTFSLDTSVGNGVYSGSGTWHTTGLYTFSFTPAGADGFVQGVTYSVLVTSVVTAVNYADVHTFTVI